MRPSAPGSAASGCHPSTLNPSTLNPEQPGGLTIRHPQRKRHPGEKPPRNQLCGHRIRLLQLRPGFIHPIQPEVEHFIDSPDPRCQKGSASAPGLRADMEDGQTNPSSVLTKPSFANGIKGRLHSRALRVKVAFHTSTGNDCPDGENLTASKMPRARSRLRAEQVARCSAETMGPLRAVGRPVTKSISSCPRESSSKVVR